MRTQCFQFVEDKSLQALTSKLPCRKYITEILDKISNATINEIKSRLTYLSSNYITFDGWTSKSNIPYLGITIRSLIGDEYYDYFLSLIEITTENQNALYIAIEISN